MFLSRSSLGTVRLLLGVVVVSQALLAGDAGATKPLPYPTMDSMSGTWIGVDTSGEVTVVVIRSPPTESVLAISHHGRAFSRRIRQLSFKKYEVTLELSQPIYDQGKALVSGTVGYGYMRLGFGRGESILLHRKEQVFSDVAAAEAELNLDQ